MRSQIQFLLSLFCKSGILPSLNSRFLSLICGSLNMICLDVVWSVCLFVWVFILLVFFELPVSVVWCLTLIWVTVSHYCFCSFLSYFFWYSNYAYFFWNCPTKFLDILLCYLSVFFFSLCFSEKFYYSSI